MPRIRTFIAIDPGKPIRDRLVSLQENMARAGAEVKWVGANNMHVTLLFLGEVDAREIPSICKAVEAGVQHLSSFEMSMEGTGCFPNPRRPRVLWVGIGKGVEAVTAVHDAIEKPLLELGCYRREERRYNPHITLGRIRSEHPSNKLTESLAKYQNWTAGETRVDEVQVMSSELTSDGPSYTVMSRAKLGR